MKKGDRNLKKKQGGVNERFRMTEGKGEMT